MRALHEESIGHAGGVGQAVDLFPIRPRHTGRCHEGDARRRAGTDMCGLDAGQLGDAAAGGEVQLAHVDKVVAGVDHSLHDFSRHHRAAEFRQRAGCVDHSLQAKLFVDVHRALLSMV